MSTELIKPIRRILFPTDFSNASETAFAYAERLAASTGAKLFILHVFAMPDFWGSGGQPEDVDAEVKRKLTDIRPSAPGTGIEVEHLAHGGKPGEVICWIAHEHHCDQIVMGTHGHTGVAHLLMGSVAEYVVRHARSPVLTVRQRAEKEKPLKRPEIYLPMPPIT